MNSKKNLYWGLQITGWSIHSLILITSILIDRPTEPYIEVILVISIYSLVGFFFTHQFRRIFNSKHWVIKNFRSHVLTIFISSIVLTFLLCVFMWLFQIVVEIIIKEPTGSSSTNTIDNYSLQAFISTIANAYAVMLIWTLLYTGFKYFEGLQNIKITKLEVESKLKDARYSILHSQLNPHFLFNSLTSIRALTLIDGEKAWMGITRLSDLLRYILDYGNHTLVTVNEEITAVKDYLEIEVIRFGEKLNYDINVSTDVLEIKVPPVSILTLVENAVKHGISNSTTKGQLGVNCFLNQQYLQVDVINTGQIKAGNTNNNSGIGIKNLLERLQILYQNDFYFDLSNRNDNRVAATLKIKTNEYKDDSN